MAYTMMQDTLLRVAEEAADGLYIVDSEGRFAFVNRAAVALFGYEDESQLLGRNSHDTTHHSRPDGSPYPRAECPLLRPLTTGESVRVDDDWFIRRDGTIVPVAYSSAPFALESGIGAVVTIRDMTEIRLLQRATLVLTSAEELSSGVSELIRLVCQATGWSGGRMSTAEDGRLGGWGREDDDFFVPVLAHGEPVAQLAFSGTPDARWTATLTAIAAQLGPVLLRKRAEDRLASQAIELARSNAELRRFTALIAHELHQPLAALGAQGREAQETIDALLRYASVGRPQMAPVDLDALVEGARIVDPLPTVMGDAAQLRLVFRNLVENAVRHGGSRVEVGFRDGELYVRDDGPGVPPGEEERVFELFARASEKPGTGLGLALARRIIEAHGGRISVSGSTFRFTLWPGSSPEPLPAAAPSAQSVPPGSRP